MINVMFRILSIKNLEDIERTKHKYREKELYVDLLMFLLVINTGLKMTNVFEKKVTKLRNKKCFNQNTAEQAMDDIDVHEQLCVRFKQGLKL